MTGELLGPAALAGDLSAALREGEEASAPLRSWRRAYADAVLGRYGAALAMLAGIGEADAVVAAAADVTRASVLRQVNLHERAQRFDAGAAARVATAHTPRAGAVAAAAAIGLVADGVGLGAHDLTARLSTAARACEHAGDDRQAVRLAWVRGEVAMVCRDTDRAAVEFGDALQRARRIGARRHQLKSRGFLAAASLVSGRLGDARRDGAAVADEAARMGALPLVWPALRVAAEAARAEGDGGSAAALERRSDAVLDALIASLPDDLRSDAAARRPSPHQ